MGTYAGNNKQFRVYHQWHAVYAEGTALIVHADGSSRPAGNEAARFEAFATGVEEPQRPGMLQMPGERTWTERLQVQRVPVSGMRKSWSSGTGL